MKRLKNYTVEDWSVEAMGDFYTPPEYLEKCICGRRVEDDKSISTSAIVDCQGNVVTTRSGSKVTLGAPSKEYLAWMEKNGYKYDPENPIKLK